MLTISVNGRRTLNASHGMQSGLKVNEGNVCSFCTNVHYTPKMFLEAVTIFLFTLKSTLQVNCSPRTHG